MWVASTKPDDNSELLTTAHAACLTYLQHKEVSHVQSLAATFRFWCFGLAGDACFVFYLDKITFMVVLLLRNVASYHAVPSSGTPNGIGYVIFIIGIGYVFSF